MPLKWYSGYRYSGKAADLLFYTLTSKRLIIGKEAAFGIWLDFLNLESNTASIKIKPN
jgi:hypothetical protein